MSYALDIAVDDGSATGALSRGDVVASRLTVSLGPIDVDVAADLSQPAAYVVDLSSALEQIVDSATRSQGAPPVDICVSYPAGWRPSQLDLVLQAVRRAGLRVDRYHDRA